MWVFPNIDSFLKADEVVQWLKQELLKYHKTEQRKGVFMVKKGYGSFAGRIAPRMCKFLNSLHERKHIGKVC